MNAGIIGLGKYVPEKVVTNFDLEKILDTNDEWIRTTNWNCKKEELQRDEDTSDMAYEAAKEAFRKCRNYT